VIFYGGHCDHRLSKRSLPQWVPNAWRAAGELVEAPKMRQFGAAPKKVTAKAEV
jgi:hypothetical protein